MAHFDDLVARIPAERILCRTGPAPAADAPPWEAAASAAISRPIGCPPIGRMAGPGAGVVILADDATRPTPQDRLLPALLDALNAAGVPDANVTVIIALGTHRYMTGSEMRQRFGVELCRRVRVVNHEWQAPDTFVSLGTSPRGIPIRANRLASEADLLIGVGSVVPHIWAGWAGGGKIVLPGICSGESIAPTHALADDGGDLMSMSGRAENACRAEIDHVAAKVGLKCVLNVVVDARGACAWAGFGEPVTTHRAGVEAARHVFVRDIPALADVAIVDASPATKDYWQGVKALAHAQRAVKPGGTIILVGSFSEGIAPSHPEFAVHAGASHDSIVRAAEAGSIEDACIVTTLRLHALMRERCRVICLSEGMTAEDQRKLGFVHAADARAALDLALEQQGEDAMIGIIDFGADVLARVAEGKPHCDS